MSLENVKLVTHKQCLDGAACAVLFVRCGGKKENIYFVSPNNNAVDKVVLNLIKDNNRDEITLVDVRCTKELAKKLNIRKNVLLIDHHKSSKELSGYSWCKIDSDNTGCGSKMFFAWLSENNYFKNKKSTDSERMFVDVVDDMDRWINKNPKAKDAATLFSAMGQDLFVDRFIKDISLCFDEKEKYLIKVENLKVQNAIREKLEQVQVYVIKNKRIGIIDCCEYQSQVGNALCQDFDLNLDFVVLFGAKYVSFRSKEGGTDVSVVAKKFQGGGHINASGCGIDGILGTNLAKLIYKKLGDANV